LRRLAALLGVAVMTAGCGSPGLGKKACPYLRPRIHRLDAAFAALPAPSAEANLQAVTQDIGIYVSQLPDRGKAKRDQPLVQFSVALNGFPANVARITAAEAAVKRECAISH
jgi:hypothetical protein